MAIKLGRHDNVNVNVHATTATCSRIDLGKSRLVNLYNESFKKIILFSPKNIHFYFSPFTVGIIRELKQRRRRRQLERQKSNRFKLAKQQRCSCITLFCYAFLCRHCTTTTWKFIFSLFVEDVNTRQRLSFSFPVTRYTALEFNSRKKCQH